MGYSVSVIRVIVEGSNPVAASDGGTDWGWTNESLVATVPDGTSAP